VTKTPDAGAAALDRDFAAAAAKPYVETYQRQHPTLKVGNFAWDQSQVVFVPALDDPESTGYLGVFFPASGSTGAGITCFAVKDADHLEPRSWGYAPDLTVAIQNFRNSAAKGGCLHVL
jgi:hypothetical protein